MLDYYAKPLSEREEGYLVRCVICTCGDDDIAGLQIERRDRLNESGGCVCNDGDVVASGTDQPGDIIVNARNLGGASI